jgi:SAM-dependent methyltransferase
MPTTEDREPEGRVDPLGVADAPLGASDLDGRIRVLVDVAGQFGVGVPLAELTSLLPTTGPERPDLLEQYLAVQPRLVEVTHQAAYPLTAPDPAETDRRRRGTEYLARAEALLEGPLRGLQSSVRCIGVTGSVAYGAPTEADDLDFLVITRAGALPWFLAATYAKLRLLRLRGGDPSAPTPCFNYVIDERRAPREFGEAQGFLFAREALTTRILRGREYYRALLARCPWMGSELPRLYATEAGGGGDLGPQAATWWTRLASAIVFLPLATYLQCGGLIRNAEHRRHRRELYMYRLLVAPDRVATRSRRFDVLRAQYETAGRAPSGAPCVPEEPSTLSSPFLPTSNGGDVVRIRPFGESPLPMRYWVEGPFIYLVAARTDRRWRAAVLRAGGCALAGPDGVERTCAADAVTDAVEASRVRNGIRRKYGSEVWDRYFRPTDWVVRLDPTRPPRAPSVHERLRWEFDALAPHYTHAVELNTLNRYLKTRTTSRLVSAFEGIDPLVEVGPGTGFETLPLLAAGHRVLAVDISEPMLAELRARAGAAGLADRLETRQAPLSELGRALEEFGPSAFGGVYSTFGAFNLEPNVDTCAATLGRAICPGGLLVFTSLNRPGLAAAAWELLLGHPREAWARLQRTTAGNSRRNALDLHPRNPGFWDRALAPGFERRDVRPVSVLTPPFEAPRLVAFLGASGRRRAREVDGVLSRHPLLAPLAEWSLLTYQRRPPDGETVSRASGAELGKGV